MALKRVWRLVKTDTVAADAHMWRKGYPIYEHAFKCFPKIGKEIDQRKFTTKQVN